MSRAGRPAGRRAAAQVRGAATVLPDPLGPWGAGWARWDPVGSVGCWLGPLGSRWAH